MNCFPGYLTKTQVNNHSVGKPRPTQIIKIVLLRSLVKSIKIVQETQNWQLSNWNYYE